MITFPTLIESPARTDALVVCLHVLFLITLYAQVRTFGYVYFDDDSYVLWNTAVRDGLSLKSVHWAFTSFYAGNWHPLTWLSHMLDVSIADIDPGWAHVHNAIIHGMNGILVYILLTRLCGCRIKGAFLSLIFLVHPQHVESVAWIAERKDVLCAFFYLIGLILYDRHQARPSVGSYLMLLFAFIFASLAKPMAVTFPVVLVILDMFHYRKGQYLNGLADSWKSRSLAVFVGDKIPLFIIALMLAVTTLMAQSDGGAVADLETLTYMDRVKNAAIGYSIYLKQFLVPTDLAIFYPFDKSWSVKELAFPFVLLIGWVAFAFAQTRNRSLVIAGLTCYLATLLPVVGLVQVGSQSHADRYMYIPSIGILLACSYLLPDAKTRYRALSLTIFTAFIAYLSFICYLQVGYWENRHTLFSRALDVSGPHWRIHVHIAGDYLDRDMPAKALEHGRIALELRPDTPMTYRSMGNIAMAMNDLALAEQYYVQALNMGSRSANLYNNLGVAFGRQNKTEDAVVAFNIALRLSPNMYTAKKNLEKYGHGGNFDTAAPDLIHES
ncbi:MAG: tetratricopeptide (TPR) repeat protein [Halieaceae bacterium]